MISFIGWYSTYGLITVSRKIKIELREYKLSPGPDGPEELYKFLRTFNKRQEEKDVEEKSSLLKLGHEFGKGPSTSATPIIGAPNIAPSVAIPTGSLHNYPKFTVLSGDGNKKIRSFMGSI